MNIKVEASLLKVLLGSASISFALSRYFYRECLKSIVNIRILLRMSFQVSFSITVLLMRVLNVDSQYRNTFVMLFYTQDK